MYERRYQPEPGAAGVFHPDHPAALYPVVFELYNFLPALLGSITLYIRCTVDVYLTESGARDGRCAADAFSSLSFCR
jgi:hypothetical protein